MLPENTQTNAPNAILDWSEQFTRERARLIAALGEVTEGGRIEASAHIGATSLPDVPTRPCLDIGLAVWPFPLEAPEEAALEALGYRSLPGTDGTAERRYLHAVNSVQLLCVAAGSPEWTDYWLLRDYLHNNQSARQEYAALKEATLKTADPRNAAYQAAKAQFFLQALADAASWWIRHAGFAPVQAVAEELADLLCPWVIAGGWAIDLFLGRVTRVHHDVDVVIARNDQLTVQAYLSARGWKWAAPNEQRLEPWPPQTTLELPRFQAHAHRDGAVLDFLFSPIENGIWRFRRDPSIVRTVERMRLKTEAGLPFLAPELALLFKSKRTEGAGRSKDEADFEKIQALLEPERRTWLRWALTITDPEHPWIERLR